MDATLLLFKSCHLVLATTLLYPLHVLDKVLKVCTFYSTLTKAHASSPPKEDTVERLWSMSDWTLENKLMNSAIEVSFRLSSRLCSESRNFGEHSALAVYRELGIRPKRRIFRPQYLYFKLFSLHESV